MVLAQKISFKTQSEQQNRPILQSSDIVNQS